LYSSRNLSDFKTLYVWWY